MIHQQKGNAIDYEGFDAGTGQNKKSIQNMIDKMKKRYITDAKPGDAAASIAEAGEDKPKVKAAPKKRAAKATEPAAEVSLSNVSMLRSGIDAKVRERLVLNLQRKSRARLQRRRLPRAETTRRRLLKAQTMQKSLLPRCVPCC